MRRARHLWILALWLGCATAPPVVPDRAAPGSTAAVPLTQVAATAPAAPAGFVEMYVAGVMPTGDGHTLFLHDAERSFFIPIGIGDSEALSIYLRLERRRFERPLTHDLLDSAMHELGGTIERVQVDGLRSGVFVGTVYIRTADRLITLDARPSDAVALALGSKAPIYVAQDVVDQAGIPSSGQIEAPVEPAAVLPDAAPEALDL